MLITLSLLICSLPYSLAIITDPGSHSSCRLGPTLQILLSPTVSRAACQISSSFSQRLVTLAKTTEQGSSHRLTSLTVDSIATFKELAGLAKLVDDILHMSAAASREPDRYEMQLEIRLGDDRALRVELQAQHIFAAMGHIHAAAAGKEPRRHRRPRPE